MTHRCGRCPVRWTGAGTCHCSACHLTFAGVTAFDDHQTGERCRTGAEMKRRGYLEVRPGILGRPTPTQTPKEGH